MNSASPIGSVRCVGVLISVSAITNSSQAALNVNIATVASAGHRERRDQPGEHAQVARAVEPE